ncbi:MAG: transporter substrate-binding domain-containing protein [Bacteroidetes bacterium]|nr:transporter substrate-binding domain-containing protein [Bacteroidota bacterium]
MKIVKNCLFIIFFLFASFNSHCREKELKIALEATYPPFEFMNSDSEIIGFDVDLIKLICKDLDCKYKIIHQPFETLLLGIQTGKFDLAIGGISINEKRAKQVNFSEIYYIDYLTLLFHANNKLTLSKKDLKGKNIGIEKGTIFENYLRKKYSKIVNIKMYGSSNDALLDLQNNRLDAFLGDNSVVKYWLLQNSERKKYDTIEILDKDYKSCMAIAVKKGNNKLLFDLNKSLKRIKNSKSYNKISNKYFSKRKIKYSKFILQLLYGALTTIEIAIISLIIGILLSSIFILLKIFTKTSIEKIVDSFLIIIRGIPEIVIILIINYSVPYILSFIIPNLRISSILTSSLALGLIFSSYATKVFVGTYRNMPIGQMKSGLVLGLSKYKIVKRIIFPQVMIQALPSINNLWLVLLKDTSIIALVGLSELMGKAKLAANSTGMHFTFFVIAAMIYLFITTISHFILKRIENNIC